MEEKTKGTGCGEEELKLEIKDSRLHHKCEKMPHDSSIHLDFWDKKTWWYNPSKQGIGLGGIEIFYCMYCGIKLEILQIS